MVIQGPDRIQDRTLEYWLAIILIVAAWLLMTTLDMLGFKTEAQAHGNYDPHTPTTLKTPDHIHQDVIEISSDESEYEDFDDGQPGPSNKAVLLSPASKRTVVIESDDDDDDDDGTDIEVGVNHSPFGSARLKRQKTDHTDNRENTNDNHIQGHFSATDFINFAGIEEWDNGLDFIDFNFAGTDEPLNEEGNGDDRATLAFRPLPNLADVQNTKSNSKGKEREYHVLLNEIEADTEQTELQAQPYYDDPIMEVRMYCGPGYDKFPIILGSIVGHQDICDEWDRKQAKRDSDSIMDEVQQTTMEAHPNDTEHAIDSAAKNLRDARLDVAELECLLKIREVFPDIRRRFALDRIRQKAQALQSYTNNGIQIQPDATSIVSEILELSAYPQQNASKTVSDLAADGTGVTIHWKKGDVESKTYQRDAVQLLAMNFGLVPTHFLYKTVQLKKTLFDSYVCISEIHQNYDQMAPLDRPYRRPQYARSELEKKYQQNQLGLRSKEQWEDLVNELQAAKQHTERRRLQISRENEEKALEEANMQSHKASGDIVECQCCFDDEIPLNRTVACEDQKMHWFCYGCVLRLAENQVGLMRFEMGCMDQSGCKAMLAKEGIRRSIPPKLLDKLEFHQQQFEISAACIEGLEQCPFCDFKAICDSVEVNMVFHCQNPDCQRITCRKCHENSHVPKSCEEAKKDKQMSARHAIEEARSEAMMRTCPQCKVKIVKEIGCNKMKCGKCSCLMCYVCQADISSAKDGGYSHFNAAGAKCILYDKDFDRHAAEADEAEKTAIEKVRAEHGDIDEKQLQIETGKSKGNKSSMAVPRVIRNVPNMLRPFVPLPGHRPAHIAPPFPPALPRDDIHGDAYRDAQREAHRHTFENMLQRVMQQERQAEAQAVVQGRRELEEIEKELGFAAGPHTPRRRNLINRLSNTHGQAPQLPANPPLHLPLIAPRRQSHNIPAGEGGALDLQPPPLARETFQHNLHDGPLGVDRMPGLLWTEPNLWGHGIGTMPGGNNLGHIYPGTLGPNRPLGQHDANVDELVHDWLPRPMLGVGRPEAGNRDGGGQRRRMPTQLGNLLGRDGM